jgi:hypothetical protein
MSNTVAIFANPGQVITLPIQTLDGYGSRTDGYQPTIESILLPNSTFATGYPIVMNKIDTGFYISRITIPTGASALGTYIVSILYDDPANPAHHEIWKIFLINCSLPFGNSSVSAR